ncbi:Flp family type IVb pilin [Rhizobium sp. Leaf262]|uniref:Flp family type IVb pilin n=1 Tax=Rhizobium sp. Leaf262 TaxID=1736312 RepID=UPI0007124F94|nr:Flp family type IVb pilin [Rhizobium sp. Leaf262]KQO83293.1 hypothetical protein ASF29_00135 [Rhizobium sp. Leaf262]
MTDTTEWMMRKLAALLVDRRGATAIEYGLIIAIISSAMILGLEGVRDNLIAIFTLLSDTFANAMA